MKERSGRCCHRGERRRRRGDGEAGLAGSAEEDLSARGRGGAKADLELRDAGGVEVEDCVHDPGAALLTAVPERAPSFTAGF